MDFIELCRGTREADYILKYSDDSAHLHKVECVLLVISARAVVFCGISLINTS